MDLVCMWAHEHIEFCGTQRPHLSSFFLVMGNLCLLIGFLPCGASKMTTITTLLLTPNRMGAESPQRGFVHYRSPCSPFKYWNNVNGKSSWQFQVGTVDNAGLERAWVDNGSPHTQGIWELDMPTGGPLLRSTGSRHTAFYGILVSFSCTAPIG